MGPVSSIQWSWFSFCGGCGWSCPLLGYLLLHQHASLTSCSTPAVGWVERSWRLQSLPSSNSEVVRGGVHWCFPKWFVSLPQHKHANMFCWWMSHWPDTKPGCFHSQWTVWTYSCSFCRIAHPSTHKRPNAKQIQHLRSRSRKYLHACASATFEDWTHASMVWCTFDLDLSVCRMSGQIDPSGSFLWSTQNQRVQSTPCATQECCIHVCLLLLSPAAVVHRLTSKQVAPKQSWYSLGTRTIVHNNTVIQYKKTEKVTMQLEHSPGCESTMNCWCSDLDQTKISKMCLFMSLAKLRILFFANVLVATATANN